MGSHLNRLRKIKVLIALFHFNWIVSNFYGSHPTEVNLVASVHPKSTAAAPTSLQPRYFFYLSFTRRNNKNNNNDNNNNPSRRRKTINSRYCLWAISPLLVLHFSGDFHSSQQEESDSESEWVSEWVVQLITRERTSAPNQPSHHHPPYHSADCEAKNGSGPQQWTRLAGMLCWLVGG